MKTDVVRPRALRRPAPSPTKAIVRAHEVQVSIRTVAAEPAEALIATAREVGVGLIVVVLVVR